MNYMENDNLKSMLATNSTYCLIVPFIFTFKESKRPILQNDALYAIV